MRNRCVRAAVCAAGAIAATCMGQPGETTGPQWIMTQDGRILGEAAQGYGSRALDYAYNNYVFDGPAGSGSASIAALNNHLLEDIDFVPGPWANAAVRGVSQVKFTLRRVQAVAQTPTDLLYTFWDRDDVAFAGFAGAGQAMINPSAAPIGQIRISIGTVNNDSINGFVVTGLSPAINLPAGESVFVEAALVNDNTSTLITTDHLRLALANTSQTAGNPAFRGTSAPDIGYDGNRDGVFIGQASISNATERRAYLLAANSGQLGLGIALGGEIPTVTPNCESFALGADNAFASANVALAQDGVAWYCVDLSATAGAIDESGRYIDIDTEGSSVDTALGIYASDGTLVDFDTGSGSGVNAQCSFGMGRRAGVGDGLQYDGRDWTASPTLARGLAAGVYYVAVAAGNGAFASGFNAAGSGVGGAAVLRVRTNATGGGLEPSAEPVAARITGLGGEDPLISPGGQRTANLDGPGVVWNSFQLCRDSSASEPVGITTAGSTANAMELRLFNGEGNLVGQASGTLTALPSLTFADSPALPAGTYFLAMTYGTAAQVDVATDAAGAGRWHVRGRNGSRGFAFAAQINVAWPDCPSGGCTAVCDFNDDGGGDNADIIDLADAIASGTDPYPNHCKDFNQDGGADNADVIDLAGAIASGTCP